MRRCPVHVLHGMRTVPVVWMPAGGWWCRRGLRWAKVGLCSGMGCSMGGAAAVEWWSGHKINQL